MPVAAAEKDTNTANGTIRRSKSMPPAIRRTQNPARGNGNRTEEFIAALIVFYLNRPVTPVLGAPRKKRRIVLELSLNTRNVQKGQRNSESKRCVSQNSTRLLKSWRFVA